MVATSSHKDESRRRKPPVGASSSSVSTPAAGWPGFPEAPRRRRRGKLDEQHAARLGLLRRLGLLSCIAEAS